MPFKLPAFESFNRGRVLGVAGSDQGVPDRQELGKKLQEEIKCLGCKIKSLEGHENSPKTREQVKRLGEKMNRIKQME